MLPTLKGEDPEIRKFNYLEQILLSVLGLADYFLILLKMYLAFDFVPLILSKPLATA